MRGIVVARKLSKNLVYILVEEDCTLTEFDNNDCESFEAGDYVTGNLQTRGSEDIYNHTQGLIISGVVQKYGRQPKPVYLPYYELFSSHPNK